MSSGELGQICQKLATYCETLPHPSWDKRSSIVDWAEQNAKYQACKQIGVSACYEGIKSLDALCMKEVANLKTDLDQSNVCDKMWTSFSDLADSAVKDVCPALQKIDPQSDCATFNVNTIKDPTTGILVKSEWMATCGKEVASLDKQLVGAQICPKLEDKLGQYIRQYFNQHNME